MLNKLTTNITTFLFSLIIFVSLIQIPEVKNILNHDAGSVALLDFWAKNNFSYGNQIIQNVGPFGFLIYPYRYTGLLDEEKFFFTIVFSGFLSILIYSLLKKFIKSNKVLFVFALLSFFLYLGNDTKYYILYSIISLYMFNIKKIEYNLIFIIILSFFSLTKGTFFYLSFIIILLYIIFLLIKKNISIQ